MRTRLDLCVLVLAIASFTSALKPPLKVRSPVEDIRIKCNSNDIEVSIYTSHEFNGMVYPKGLAKNSTCMTEYTGQGSPVRYRLSLRNCNTMGVQQEEDTIDYFNTIVVQPHRKLVTNQGRGFHVRCKYQTREKANIAAKGEKESTALASAAAMPVCSMRIFSSSAADKTVAETVKIGDQLTMEITIDQQEVYGLRVVDCIVRDGLGWGQQPLINSEGCPVDFDILGPLKYSDTKTSASASFLAHKFPYTSSVYYQCNVRLCLKQTGGCDDVPPICKAGTNVRRRRELSNATVSEDNPSEEAVIEVFSGLYVDEGAETDAAADDGPTKEDLENDDLLCISPRIFAIVIAIIGLLLMIAVVVAIMIIINRRRRRKDMSATGSSIYSGPYTNTAYSHSS